MKTGSCLCGAVTYQLSGQLRDVVTCHCIQSRKTSGHFVAATAVLKDQLKLIRDAGLAWYQSSDEAKRGFCKICGASLFWWPFNEEHVSVHAGTIDGDTGVTTERDIFTDTKGDYYDLPGEAR